LPLASGERDMLPPGRQMTMAVRDATSSAASGRSHTPDPLPCPRPSWHDWWRCWRPSRRALVAVSVLLAALWGMVVDSPLIPVLAPTGNSTLFQASTAALFAVIGIVFGPLAGALGGLVRDATGYALTEGSPPHASGLEPQWCGGLVAA
jgi:hypothetical protein